MTNVSSGGFQCPLRSPYFDAARPFPSRQASNQAVASYKACTSPGPRRQNADQLYLRHLPLVRKTLSRFCPKSDCYPGACLVEELVGESYPVFQHVLDDYEPSFGVDFLGYASKRLYWALEHRVRQLERILFRAPPPQFAEQLPSRNDAEDRHLNRVFARDLLERLDPGDAKLMARYAAGHSCRELAECVGLSSAAVRKRLERLRGRLRGLVGR